MFLNAVCQLMANGTFAFFTSHTMSTTDAIKSYSSTFRMPFISSEIAINNTDQEFGYELYLRPYYVKAIADFIKHKNWKNIWYLYDSDAGIYVLYCIVLYCIVLYCIVLYCIVLHCIALHCIALHCIALHCIALYCIVLYCNVLYCICTFI